MIPATDRLSKLPYWLLVALLFAVLAFWTFTANDNYKIIFSAVRQGLWTTIYVSVIAYVVAMLLGMLWMLMRVSQSRVLQEISSFFVEVIRGIPMLVLLYFISFVGGPALVTALNWLGGPLIDRGLIQEFNVRQVDFTVRAILALSIGYSAFISEIFRAGIESIEKEQKEAAQIDGANYWQVMRFILLPQAVRNRQARRGVSIVSTPSAAADIASVVINLSWCSFKYFGRGTGTTAGTQCLYYYATCSNAPGYSIPVGNCKLVGVVVDELSNVQPEGTIYFGSDLATSAEGYQVDGLHFVHTIRKGFTYSLDGILKSKNITATYVVSTAAYYAVFGRWGDCRVENVWACSPTNGSASNLYGFFRSISNCRIYGGYGIYFASLASGGDNYRYATINEAVVDGCKFYNCAYGVLASASGAPCYGVLGGIVIKNCEFFASYNSSVYSWNALAGISGVGCRDAFTFFPFFAR